MKANLIAKEKGDAKITIAFTSEEFEQAQIDTYKKEKKKSLQLTSWLMRTSRYSIPIFI